MSGDIDRLSRSPHDLALLKKAQEQLQSDDCASALAAYRHLTSRFPLVPELWFEMGQAAGKQLDFSMANTSLRQARSLAAGNASLLILLGRQYETLRQTTDAEACFEEAVAANPASPDARISLARWFEKKRQLEKAMAEVEASLALNPRDEQSRYFQALLWHRQRRNAEAETALRRLIQDEPQYPYLKYASHYLLGQVLDESGDYAAAWRCLIAAKACVRQLANPAPFEKAFDEAAVQRGRMLNSLISELITRWQNARMSPEVSPRIAFLGGHPRSGTTLLEQILDAHGNLLAFDESPAFRQQVAEKIRLPRGSGEAQVKSLDGLPGARIVQFRDGYLKHLLHEVEGETRAEVLLDKNPSLTFELPYLLKVLPHLKVIISLRDPRDVVLSCFFQNLVLNGANLNFLSLERVVKHYSALMTVWLRLRDLGGFAWRESRYEELIDNPVKEGRKCTEFLGLNWRAEQENHPAHTRPKCFFAPTYHEANQPVYRRAVGRWTHYAEQLEPIRAPLEKFCEILGYPV